MIHINLLPASLYQLPASAPACLSPLAIELVQMGCRLCSPLSMVLGLSDSQSPSQHGEQRQQILTFTWNLGDMAADYNSSISGVL